MRDSRELTFVFLPTYERTAKGVISDDAQRWLEETICAAPRTGAVIRGTGGVRKVRVALPGRGKSGGARVVYYYRSTKGRIYLILAYSKNTKDDLTRSEEAALKKLTATLETE
ncbi:MAG TPA: type II toxin-antitoxin system RelE/ParE family toxin [Gemmatimonadaceae bacterium]|jgi:hypothetical protein|nr:type II toxin-antitoxin system RelE/ParE family toxin [Gemmatimonadaceae bacterium]